jgi:hypothetical protein
MKTTTQNLVCAALGAFIAWWVTGVTQTEVHRDTPPGGTASAIAGSLAAAVPTTFGRPQQYESGKTFLGTPPPEASSTWFWQVHTFVLRGDTGILVLDGLPAGCATVQPEEGLFSPEFEVVPLPASSKWRCTISPTVVLGAKEISRRLRCSSDGWRTYVDTSSAPTESTPTENRVIRAQLFENAGSVGCRFDVFLAQETVEEYRKMKKLREDMLGGRL